MNTATTQQLKALGANFGDVNAEWARYATIGNRQFVRCYQAGENIWEEGTAANPIKEWTFTRESGVFHTRVKTTLSEALRIAADWNNDCPSRAIAEIRYGTLRKAVALQLSLIAA